MKFHADDVNQRLTVKNLKLTKKARAPDKQYDKYEARVDKWRKMRGAN